ncbi:MAG: hypothetical protein LC792_22915 [Actinobacteria bacterium]|nr:hypothetical protein [Actinomycetota bacterium]
MLDRHVVPRTQLAEVDRRLGQLQRRRRWPAVATPAAGDGTPAVAAGVGGAASAEPTVGAAAARRAMTTSPPPAKLRCGIWRPSSIRRSYTY